jgi:hypothetical protein
MNNPSHANLISMGNGKKQQWREFVNVVKKEWRR